MKARALLLSLLAHLGLGAAAYYWSLPASTEKQNLVIEAPLGDVFVQEENPAPAPPSPSPRPEEGAYSEEVKPTTSPPSVPGLPDGEAHPVGSVKPEYPAVSRKLGEEGEAVFLLAIDEEGRVTEAKLEQSSGYERLDDAARETLLEAKFHPAIQSGKMESSLKRFRIEFRLNPR